MKEDMDFGLAITALKDGQRVARKGWNGKGMCLYFVEGTTVALENLRANCASAIESSGVAKGSFLNICGHVDMIASDGSIVVGWLASQTDMLSDDWYIVE